MPHAAGLTVTFISDFGPADGFVGTVHLVIAGIAPPARVIDLTHDLAPHDVRGGAYTLERAGPWLSPVVLAIVDPGTGTDRRAVAVEAGQPPVVLIGPDNGLLLPAARSLGGVHRAVVLDVVGYHRGPTIRQRSGAGPVPGADAGDVFAPVAGWAARGVELGQLGHPLDPADLVTLDEPVPVEEGDGFRAHVRWVDRFGNVELNLTGPPPGPVTVRVGERSFGAVPAVTFAAVPVGSLGLVVDAHGWATLACAGASAARQLGLRSGDTVWVSRGGRDGR